MESPARVVAELPGKRDHERSVLLRDAKLCPSRLHLSGVYAVFLLATPAEFFV